MHESANAEMNANAGVTSAIGSRGIDTLSWQRYLFTVAGTFAVLLMAYMGVLAGLQRTDNLPAPSIVNEICADEKLRWLREEAPENPGTLIVGSSVAFRNVDVGQIALQHASARPLNGGVCHLQVNQTAFVTQYLLRHFPTVQTVAATIGPQDLVNCAKTPARLFDPDTADAYVFERRWPYRFYFTQFDVVSLLRNATRIKAIRNGSRPLDTLVITRYGDGPLDTDVSRDLTYGSLVGYDPACFAALRDLASTVVSGGRRFVVTTNPVSPAWTARFDGDNRLHAEMIADIRAALHDTGAEFWDGARRFGGETSEFTDAIHLKWSAAHRYGALLAAALDAPQEHP